MPRWDIFCRVIDNFGDIGVCWRLARQLAVEHHVAVRLWVDDLATFSRLCSRVSSDRDQQLVDGVEIRRWSDPFPVVEAADVVIEGFACHLPDGYVATMAAKDHPPVWLNLEYLSAEAWVEDCHLLRSPQSNSSLVKHFFFPGFTPQTGGLLRERDLLRQRAAFGDAAEAEFWGTLQIPERTPDELRISLFCYQNAALPDLLQWAANHTSPVRLFAFPGAPLKQVEEWLGQPLPTGSYIQTGALTIHSLPFLPSETYDRLLWACDVNFVRGEDSFVRAQWAQKPFVWQIYPQAEATHLVKLNAFLDKFLAKSEDSDMIRPTWLAWNGQGDLTSIWPQFVARRESIRRHAQTWATQLDQSGNLANNLAGFVRGK